MRGAARGAAWLLMLPLLSAQQDPAPAASTPRLEARDFRIPDCQNLIVVDFAAARREGVWQDLEASVLSLAFRKIEAEAGFPLDALDRFRASVELPEEPEGGMAARRVREVRVFEGNRALTVHESFQGGRWTEERIGACDVRRRQSGSRDELFVQPRPELQVWGSTEVLRPVLEGKQPAELVSPDVQSLLSGRQRRFAWLVLRLDNETMRARFLERVMGADLSAWPEDDGPTHLSLQVFATGDADDPHLSVRAVLRHAKAGAGVEVSQQAGDAFVERLREDKRMRAVRKLLAKAATKLDHTDAVLEVDLGRSRSAVGNLATMLLPMIGREGDRPGGGR